VRAIQRLLLLWAGNVAALFIAHLFVDGVSYGDDWWALLIAGLVFGIVNSLIRPVLRLFMKTAGLPIVLLTFGLALFAIDVLMLYITSWIVDDFTISSFGAAVAGAAVIWVVHLLLEAAFGIGRGGRSDRR
jgi:putative membrane protein